MIIAIDGPAASGKGTLAKRLAARHGLAHLDSGLLYRAVAKAVADAGAAPGDRVAAIAAARALDPHALDAESLRARSLGEASSLVAAIPDVRAALLEIQRAFAAQAGGAVIDGRDIGTVICPAADVKLFVTAAAAVRAERRQRELLARGEQAEYAAVLADIERRDARDSSRAVSPLVAAPDAIVLDTTNLSPERTYEAACAIVDRRLARLTGT